MSSLGDFLPYIKHRIGSSTFRSWFSNVEIELDDHSVIVYVDSLFIKDWIENHYSDVIANACQSLYDTSYRIQVKKTPSAPIAFDNNHGEIVDVSMPLDDRSKFETFVVGPSNNLAFEATKRVSEEINVFNPLFIYGNSGSGKTHLLQSTARIASASKRVCYISAEQYVVSFVKALKTQDIMSFKEAFRNVDVLIIDDIQFMGGKNLTQDEFFHTLVHLLARGKQIVAAADKPARELSGIEDRWRTRLGGGLPIKIYPAPYELRLGILQKKSELSNRKIHQSILELIAYRVSTSIRELEGALFRMWAQVDFFGSELTLDVANAILDDMLASNKSILCEDIISVVLSFYKLTREQLFSSSRLGNIVLARQIVMMLCREIAKKSFSHIAKIFGGNDHTKVLYSVNTIRNKCKKNAAVASDIDKIKDILTKKE